MSGATHTLAQFIADSRWGDVPDDVRHEAARAILNWLGCAIGGCRDETVDVMICLLYTSDAADE